MGSLGEDYGSERHLLNYRRHPAATLDERILHAMKVEPSRASLQWLHPDQSGNRGKEFTGLSFLKTDSWAPGTQKALDAWASFWPTSGTLPSWDGVAILHENDQQSRWLLLEAKANHPEFTGAPSRALPPSLKKIKVALETAKRHFAVHRDFDWTGSYYQFANRLTLVRFLNLHGVPATLIEVLFTGDRFPDRRPCPETEAAWQPLLEARRLTLGLRTLTPDDHVVDIFLNASPG
jgi:hypothetical protein